ncbi:MAG: hypothetical protein C3F11_11805 [Methylocystaceae bacterium]|nr:MAG: hypothetical protein C3F11_11805 [Methylocystaceae bacterium]
MRDSLFSSRASRIVLAATVAASLCAAVAAAPSASVGKEADTPLPVPIKAAFGDSATALRPLGHGPAIRVGRAYDPEDEDCTLVVTQVTDRNGRVSVTRGIACAN